MAKPIVVVDCRWGGSEEGEERRGMEAQFEARRDAGRAHDRFPHDLAAASTCNGKRTGHQRITSCGTGTVVDGEWVGYGYDECLDCGATTEALAKVSPYGSVRLPRHPNRQRRWLPAPTCLHSHGRCYRCKMPWCLVDSHSTEDTYYSGLFPLCERCWRVLSPEKRVPFYRRLFDSWVKDDLNRKRRPGVSYPDLSEARWEAIERTVLAGN